MILREATFAAWATMRDHAMPAGVALDFVCESGCTRAEAVEALLIHGVSWMSNQLRKDHNDPPTWFFAAGQIAGLLLSRKTALARETRDELSRNVGAAQTHALDTEDYYFSGGCDHWFQWLETVARVTDLVEQILAAENPNGGAK